MIIVDSALKKREAEGNPIKVGVIGAGYMGRGLVLQIITAIPGMEVAAVSNRTISKAATAYHQAEVEDIATVTTVGQLEDAISKGKPAITDDPLLLCQAEGIEAIVEATGEVEFGAKVVLEAIKHGKHVILMNAELDAVVGPILKEYADKAGVVITNVDGDQPGVIMNLLRWVETIGYRPVLAGNIKGLQDHYRTPETQKGFAENVKQDVKMITSFADGTKISMEMAVVANATGFTTGKRGMYGPTCSHVTEAPKLFPMDQMMDTGLVDYILGAEPAPGVFILGYNEHPIQRQYLNYYKMGEGPLYTFYTPYHLCHLEAPLTAARAVLFQDAACAPIGPPVCDVITVAKKDLVKGELLDGIGGFATYGMLEKSPICSHEKLLPMGLSEGCKVKRNISQDQAISYGDVEVPAGRLVDTLRREQEKVFAA